MFGFLLPFGKTAALRAKADGARDRREWGTAAQLYKRYLSAKPKSPDIWVQYGHALKESGNLDAAAVAYAKALSLEPSNFDTHLQLGHLLKLQGNESAAVHSYKTALSLNPSHPDAPQELRALGVSDTELVSLLQEDRAEVGPDPSSVTESRLSALEQERGPLRRQFELLVARLSDTKALHFEIQRQGAELARLQARQGEVETTISRRITSNRELEAEHSALKLQLGRLVSSLADSRAIHFEVRRQEAKLSNLEGSVINYRSEVESQLETLAKRWIEVAECAKASWQHAEHQIGELKSLAEVSVKEFSVKMTQLSVEAGEQRGTLLEMIQKIASDAEAALTQCAEMRRLTEGIGERLDEMNRQYSAGEVELANLRARVTDVIARVDDPLQDLVVQLADNLQKLSIRVGEQDARLKLYSGENSAAQSSQVHQPG